MKVIAVIDVRSRRHHGLGLEAPRGQNKQVKYWTWSWLQNVLVLLSKKNESLGLVVTQRQNLKSIGLGVKSGRVYVGLTSQAVDGVKFILRTFIPHSTVTCPKAC